MATVTNLPRFQAPVDILQRVQAAEESFRIEQARALEKFIAEQRRILEDGLGRKQQEGHVVAERTEGHGVSAETTALTSASEVRAPVPAQRGAHTSPRSPGSLSLRGIKELGKKLVGASDSDSNSSEEEGDQDPDKWLWENEEDLHDRSKSLKQVSRYEKIKGDNCLQRLLGPVVQSDWFDTFSAVVVLSTVAQIGGDIHFRMKDHFKEDSSAPAWLSMRIWMFFNFWSFFVEMVLRIAAYQRTFFCGEHVRWNLFDIAMLSFNCVYLTGILPPSVFNCARVVRLLRMIRVFEIFPDLRTMLYSIAACGACMGWALVLLFAFFWMFSCFLMELALQHAQEASDDNQDVLRHHWNGLFHSMLSLVYSITGGISWGELAEPFFHMSNGWPGVLFAVFVIATVFGLLNVLVGVFCCSIDDISVFDRESVLGTALQKRKDRISDLEDLFHEMDERDTGRLFEEDFVKEMSKPRAQAYFDHLEIHYMDPRRFFHKLDTNEPFGSVDIHEFTKGCMRLQGTGRPEDIVEILNKLDHLTKVSAHLKNEVEAVSGANSAAKAREL